MYKIGITLLAATLLVTLSYLSLAWSVEETEKVSESLYVAQRECDHVYHDEYRGAVYSSIQGWSELVDETGQLPADTILVIRWFADSLNQNQSLDFSEFEKWEEAIKYVLDGRKKKSESYSYTITQRATHISAVSNTKSNILRINAGTNKEYGIDFFVSFDPKFGYVTKDPNEYSFLTCGLNLLTLE